MPVQPEISSADQLNRELSPFEVVFWRLAQAGSLNVTMIAEVHGRISEDALSAGLRLLRRRHPLLQVRICCESGTPRYNSADVPDIPIRIVEADPSDVESIVEEEISTPIDAERGPLARCTWIHRDEMTHQLLITFHHVIGDGMSGVFLVRDLVQAIASQLTGRTDQLAPELIETRPIDLRLPPEARGLRAVSRQVRFVARVAWEDVRLRPPSRPRADQPAPLSARRTRLICRTLDPTIVERLANKARSESTTVHGALSAAICLATAHDNSADSMSIKHRSPINLRQFLDPPVGEDVGLFVSMTFYRGRVKSDDDFWSLAREIRSSIKNQIDRGVPTVLIGMLPRLYRMIRGDRVVLADFGARWQQHTPSTTGLTNLGRVELTGDLGPLEVRSLHFAVAPGGLGDSACTATTYAGSLRWNFLYASPIFADDRAQRITDDAVVRLERAIGLL